MQSCRNCGSGELRELGFVGEVAPFFLKRVLNLEIGTSRAQHPLRLLARRVCALPHRLMEKVYGGNAYAEMQVCLSCSFVQVKHAFSDDALGRLYADYRSASYNRERIHYEPSYAALAEHVGADGREVECRVGGLTVWLTGKLEGGPDLSMLDYGGSDGRFLPRLAGRKFVYEISDIAPLPGIVRISTQAELAQSDYVQIAHVLEHVPEPLALLKQVAGYVKPSAYLYIEVPQDLTDLELEKFRGGEVRRGLTIHEHINVYCAQSVGRLVEAAGLEPISLEAAQVDLGWVKGTNIRALCKRRA